MNAATPGGKFITFEGGEGAGKTSQLRLLAEKLRERGIVVEETREPNGPIRDLLVSGDVGAWRPRGEALLHFAARSEHLERVVFPALEAGEWVISDRFADSTMAYQGIAQGLGTRFVNQLYELVVGSFKPDLTMILDVPVSVGLARASSRTPNGEDRYERMGRAFHETLREAFHDIANAEPNRCVLIDAEGDVDSVADEVWRIARNRFDLV